MRPARSVGRAALFALVAVLASLALGCSGKIKGGGLVVIVATDMATPREFDAVEFRVEQQSGEGTWGQKNLLRDEAYPIPSALKLPTTISLLAGESPYQRARITVTGRKGGLPVVRSVVETPVPADRVGELTILLSSTCLGILSCDPGLSCRPVTANGIVKGTCAPSQISASELKDYSHADEDAGIASISGASVSPDGGGGNDGGDASDSSAGGNGGDGSAVPVDSHPSDAATTDAAATTDVSSPQVDSGNSGDASTANTDGASADGGRPRDGGEEATVVVDAGTKLDGGTTTVDAGDAGPIACPVCGMNQTCAVANGAAMCVCKSTICTAVGSVCSGQQTVATCESDANHCLFVAQSTPCVSPSSCSGMSPLASCSPTCQDSCTLGQTSCDPAGLKSCARGSNGCLALGAPVACGPHQSCTGAVGSGACKCNADPICTAAGKACIDNANLATCAVDAQGCAYQASSTLCPEGPCRAGACTDGLRHGPFKILVISTALDFPHDSIATGLQMLTELGNTSDADLTAIGAPVGSQWTVDSVVGADPMAASYLSEITAANLKNYELVYSNNPSGQVFTAATDGAAKKLIFQDYLDNGGSWAGHHSAADFERNNSWIWFQDNLSGGWMVDHDSAGAAGTVSVETAYTNHPVVRGLPVLWDVLDEWYIMNRNVEAVAGLKVLAKVTVPTSTRNTLPRPAIWVKENAKGGRAFYTIRGHAKAVFAEPAFRDLTLRGILWAVQRLK